MKKITISFIMFLVTTICFAGDYSICGLFLYDVEKMTNSTIPVFVGTNQFNVPFYEFVGFIKKFNEGNLPKCPKGPKGERGLTNLEEYVTNSFPTNFSLNDFAWEPDEKLKQLWGDYYNSPEKTDDSSEETFNGIPIIKGGPAKEAILECVIENNSNDNYCTTNNYIDFSDANYDYYFPLMPGVYIGTNRYDWNSDEAKQYFEESRENWEKYECEHTPPLMDWQGRLYDYDKLKENFKKEISKNTTNQYGVTNLDFDFLESRLDDITWYYENFDGYVNVYFEVVGYGFSNTSKMALEEEIREAIQKIIDLHFPKEKP